MKYPLTLAECAGAPEAAAQTTLQLSERAPQLTTDVVTASTTGAAHPPTQQRGAQMQPVASDAVVQTHQPVLRDTKAQAAMDISSGTQASARRAAPSAADAQTQAVMTPVAAGRSGSHVALQTQPTEAALVSGAQQQAPALFGAPAAAIVSGLPADHLEPPVMVSQVCNA